MSWNPFKKEPKDIELPQQYRRDPRLPKEGTTPLKTLKESMDTWKRLNTDEALTGLKKQ
jgi:hypothetical protein